MTKNDISAFVSDIVTEIRDRRDAAQADMKAAPDDSFSSGRALAYQEMFEIVQSRLKIYGINNVEVDNR